MKLYIFSIVLMIMFQSCNGQKNTEQIISRIDNIDFSPLQGISIYFRSKGHSRNTNIYFLNEFKGKCSPYSVEVDKSNIDGLIINNDLVLKSCNKDYLSSDEIKTLIKEYVKLDLCLVQVDNFGNIYINPDKQEAPVLLKLSGKSPPKDLGEFKEYKDNWYIRK